MQAQVQLSSHCHSKNSHLCVLRTFSRAESDKSGAVLLLRSVDVQLSVFACPSVSIGEVARPSLAVAHVTGHCRSAPRAQKRLSKAEHGISPRFRSGRNTTP